VRTTPLVKDFRLFQRANAAGDERSCASRQDAVRASRSSMSAREGP
jgi:hypothetical protein